MTATQYVYHMAFWLDTDIPFLVRMRMVEVAREMGAKVDFSDPIPELHEGCE